MSLEIPMTFTDGLDHEPNAFSILIVDSDSDDARHLVQTILAPRGYRTTVVRTGRRALITIRQTHIDLILLSWHLVDMEGGKLLQTLAGSGRRSPTIVLAPVGSEHVAASAFRLGARGFLRKPLDVDDTIRAIRQVLTEGWGRRRDTRIIESMRQRLQRSVVFHQVVQPIISLRLSQELFTQIVDAAILVTGAEEGFLFLQQRANQHLELRAVRLAGQQTARILCYPAGDVPARQVMLTGQPFIMEADDWTHSGEGYPVRSAIHVPLKALGQILGVLSVDRKDSHEPFTVEDRDILLQLANYAALALDNYQLFESMNPSRSTESLPCTIDSGSQQASGPKDGNVQHYLVDISESPVDQIL